jgi:ABC-2 type transport system permease protein
VTARRAVALVARRELRERLRSKAFMASLAVQLLILVGVVAISALSGSGPETVRVGSVTPADRAVAEAARSQARALDLKVEVRRLPDGPAAVRAVRDERVDIALAGGRLVAGSDPDAKQVALLQSAARDVRARALLRADGLTGAEIERALAPPPLQVTEVDDGQAGQGLAAIASLLLYVALFSVGFYVASGVIEEKSSRVVELILSTIRPVHLMAGKVLGIGLVGIVQVAVVGGVGIAVALASGEVELPSATAETAALVVVYFVFGYALYAAAFAAAGSLVTRQEDSQSSTTPLMALLLAGYFASLAVIDDADSTLATVCSFLPPIAPMVVPARAAQDALPAWELAVSLVLMAAATALLLRLAARVYERSVLRLGAPVRLREALRLARTPSRPS